MRGTGLIVQDVVLYIYDIAGVRELRSNEVMKSVFFKVSNY